MAQGSKLTRHGRQNRAEERVVRFSSGSSARSRSSSTTCACPGSHSRIDHVVVAPSGVWVVDSNWQCDLPLDRDSLDQATSVDEVERLVGVVANAVGSSSTELPIRAALCFPAENWGGDPRAFSIEGVLVTYPTDLVERVRAAGPLDEETMGWVAARLALDPQP